VLPPRTVPRRASPDVSPRWREQVDTRVIRPRPLPHLGVGVPWAALMQRGWVISARLTSSNSDICRGPVSAASAAIAGARSAVTQPIPPSSRNASIRAEVIMPRPPTITICCSPKRSRTAVTAPVNAVGSAVLPATTRTATGRWCGDVVGRNGLGAVDRRRHARRFGRAARIRRRARVLQPGRGRADPSGHRLGPGGEGPQFATGSPRPQAGEATRPAVVSVLDAANSVGRLPARRTPPPGAGVAAATGHTPLVVGGHPSRWPPRGRVTGGVRSVPPGPRGRAGKWSCPLGRRRQRRAHAGLRRPGTRSAAR